MQNTRPSKSCDQCRNRKVRCHVTPTAPGVPTTCVNCIKRNETCHFSDIKRSSRRKARLAPEASRVSTHPQSLFIDQVVRNPSESALLYDEFSVLRAHDQRVPSSSIAFFDDDRINSLTRRIGSTQLREVVHQIDSVIRQRLLARSSIEFSRVNLEQAQRRAQIPLDEARVYIDCYFETIHCVYPFLDRAQFEAVANDSRLCQTLDNDFAFCALYYAILALGCQYRGCSSFEAGSGKAWNLFQTSFACIPRILISGECLKKLQAVIAMALFCTSVSCVQVDHFLLAEASRMVLALRYHKSSVLDAEPAICHRAFWVVYHMEKQYKFQARNNSAIDDCDIGCPIPTVPESILGEYNWFLSSVRISRVYSAAYSALFSVTASTRSPMSLLPTIDHLEGMLEEWRQSVPPGFRPREVLEKSWINSPASKEIVLRTHFYYFHLTIALERLKLHLRVRRETTSSNTPTLLDAARGVIELVRFIDVEPFTPIFILAIMPLSALFIVFDFVVHHPRDPKTQENLMLLDIVSGHFSVLELASNGSLRAGYLSYFSHIARQFVHSIRESAAYPDSPDRAPSVGVQMDHNAHQPVHETESSVQDETPITGGHCQTSELSTSLGGSLSHVAYANPELLSDDGPWPYSLQVGTETDLAALFSPIITWESLSQ